MNKKFTKLIAALALLVFMTPTMVGWGQTRTEVTDHMTANDLAATGTTYKAFSNVSLTSAAVYAGKSALNNNVNIQLRSSGSDCGIVTTTSGGKIKSITITVASGSNKIDVYGKNTAYTSAEQLYNTNYQGTKLGTVTSTGTITVTADYEYVGIRSYNGAVYISSIDFVWEDSPSPAQTSNVAMASVDNVDLTATYGTSTLTEGNDADIEQGTQLTLAYANVASGKVFDSWVITDEDDTNVTSAVLEGNILTVPAYDITISATLRDAQQYTVTFDAGTGTAVSPITGFEGSTINLPTTTPSAACVSRGWEFAGWATASVSETTTAPALLSGEYPLNDNATLYAVYKVTEGDGGTETFDFETIASNNNWSNATVYNPVTQGAVTLTGDKGTSSNDCPIYYSTDYSWRMYKNSSLTVSSSAGNVTAVTSTPSQTFTINNNGTATISFSATVKFTEIIVTYGSSTTTYNSNPSCLPMVATPTFTPAAGTYTGSQNVTINCTTEDASILYKTTEEGEWLTYSNAIPVSTTTTIWAKATKNGMDESEIATATYTIQYTLTVDIDDVVEYFLYDYTNETWEEITIDDEGHALVSSGADVRISGGEVYDDCYEVESFNVTDGNNNPVTVVDNTEEDGTYSFIMPASNATLTVTLDEIATHYTLTVEGLDRVSFEMYVGEYSGAASLSANHQTSVCEQSGILITGLAVGNGYVLESVTLDYGNETQTITPEYGVYAFNMPSSDAMLTFTTSIATSFFERYSGALTEGDYLIVYNGKAMNNTVSSDRLQYDEVTPYNNGDVIATNDDNEAFVWHIAQSGNYWTIYNEEANAYAASTGAKNKAQMLADGTDDKALWTVTGTDTYEFENKDRAAGSDPNNKWLRNNGAYGFACYASSTGGALSLYKKVSPQNYTTMEIAPNQWYFIASPTGTAPINVEALSDLYYYDEQDHYWRNQKVFANAEGFVNFDLGKGYLAANAGVSVTESVTLTFTGVAITANSYSVDLEYNANTSGNETNTLAGWNLVGNPFPSSATINKDFYVISGRNVVANTGSTVIAPCTGVMVQAEGENESVTFTKVAEGQTPQPNQLQMTVAQNATNRGTAETIDNAIVSFNEGSQLEKFIFNADLSKLYIPQNDKEYAIVSAEAQGEMPVNFRATENGTYTLSIAAEGMEMNYLYLIDNMTGANINLLQTPSYTFNAKTTDYESRFRLVFAGASTGSATDDNFAFFSNGNLIINNDGNATLQVIDLTGRILSSENVNGSVSTTLNATPGVYMLRLINGENVKVQKIVVR